MGAGADAGTLPPEVNYTNMTVGDQMLSTSLAAAAHEALGSLLGAETARMGATTAATLMEWIGVGGAAMGMTSAQLESLLGLMTAWFESGAAALTEVMAAYHATVPLMIPAPVSLANRSTQATLVSTNFLGFNQPAIDGLDATYASHWAQNASLAGTLESTIMAVVATLGVPAPMGAPMSNPATAAAGAAEGVAQNAGTNALQQGAAQLSNSPAAMGNGGGGPSGAAGSGTDMIQSVLPTMMQTVSQSAGIVNPQSLSQLPQTLGQGAGQFGSLLSPLLSSNALGAGLSPTAVTPVGNLMTGGAGVTPGVGSLPGAGLAGPATSYTRPVSNFGAPSSPSLPGAWKNTGRPVAGETPAGFGGGGLYGAPPMAGTRGGGSSAQQGTDRNRTLSVSARETI